jgi:quinohemoprotein amine dehydrogenase
MTVIPAALKTGTTQQVIVVGKGLHGAVDLGPGTTSRVLARRPYGLVLSVSVDADAATGYRTVRVGGVRKGDLLAIYRRVDRLEVEPAFAIARVGGGTLAPVDAQFEAIGYTDVVSAHGEVTSVRLGAMPANWSVEPFNAEAAKGGDIRFAGTLNQDGRFQPAEGGPDSKRQFLADDLGNLFGVATYKAGTTDVAGKAHLIVTVQRWINPPIY